MIQYVEALIMVEIHMDRGALVLEQKITVLGDLTATGVDSTFQIILPEDRCLLSNQTRLLDNIHMEMEDNCFTEMVFIIVLRW